MSRGSHHHRADRRGRGVRGGLEGSQRGQQRSPVGGGEWFSKVDLSVTGGEAERLLILEKLVQ